MKEIIFLIIALVLYFLPAIVGMDKDKSSGIMILNLFLGWTMLGWVIALVWAVSANKETK